MYSKYFIVPQDMLPEAVEKVLEAKELLQEGVVSQVSEACEQVGISRSSYYKYKDVVHRFQEQKTQRKANISVVLRDEKGMLSSVLATLSQFDANILTINQSLPINNIASVHVVMDVSLANIDSILEQLRAIDGVHKVSLLAME
ncbi:MAG: ACT domain-containing protein [Erysipelotrichaceae bacterium]